MIRSLTKTWGLAGLRIGYLLADPDLVDRLRAAQPHWPVSTPALAAAIACVESRAQEEALDLARTAESDRRYLESSLAALPGVTLPACSRAPFVLAHAADADRIRLILRERGFALRRADTFPGLGPDWFRIAVRGKQVTDALIEAWPTHTPTGCQPPLADLALPDPEPDPHPAESNQPRARFAPELSEQDRAIVA